MALPDTESIVATFLDELKGRLGPDLVQVWLFGSQVRGDAVEGSDYDIYTPNVWSQAKNFPLGINVLREGRVVA
jgi:predicted nucleotidyltransferase